MRERAALSAEDTMEMRVTARDACQNELLFRIFFLDRVVLNEVPRRPASNGDMEWGCGQEEDPLCCG